MAGPALGDRDAEKAQALSHSPWAHRLIGESALPLQCRAVLVREEESQEVLKLFVFERSEKLQNERGAAFSGF